MLGFGNWHEIEKIIATKSALQCQDHYINTYIKSPKAPFPVRKVLPRVDPEPIPLSYQIRDTESKPSIGHKDNLKKRNKTRPTTTGEYSDYMPYRHEFDKEYQNSAESIVGSLKFCSDETESSFQSKVERLQSYNFILQERRFRTKIIEDWRIQDIEVKTDSKMKHTIVGKDIELVRLLDPATSELREINSKILPLAPYIGHRKTLQLVQAVDKNIQNDFHIKTLRTWQSYHITSLHEGHMFKALSNYVNEKITDIDKWNDLIRKYGNTKSQTVETQFLSPEEKILCASIRVNQDMYLAIKEFMIREYSVDGHFDREKLKMITNKDLTLKQLEEIYDYMVGNGWIAE
ncbi:Myb-like DNA-binding domain containing protein [Histomonas meleagridis]|uniref:Myb-like DNA-binding domain containing protein n=1 Tax=Histomonas meleagridis TaxID=135588 RepID=UPI00355AC7B3|nr:Myb-like DNA-binding domain containing protein [Histomonas meleagridis]KAH0799626.1 Myb-like DNA-binding domain containing protein [Histomonas meleagridis]